MEASNGKAQSSPGKWLGLWVLFACFHGCLMALDWHLRIPTPGVQPMPGGLPGSLDRTLSAASLVLLGFAVYCLMPRSWPSWVRAILAVIQVVVALAILIGARLLYVLHNGIDTL